MIIRPEIPADQAQIHALHTAAFGQRGEGDLVDTLRRTGKVVLSVVAEEDGVLLGHVCFSPVQLTRGTEVFQGAGLAPLAVLPGRQRGGVGRALVEASLPMLKHTWCVLLGSPAYYGRFGFRAASTWGLTCEWPEHGDAFQALELQPGALTGWHGLVRYDPVFSGFD